jgi:probable HAF family extracellular repeat protein
MVVGESETGTGATHAFRWTPGSGMQDFLVGDPAVNSDAVAVNEAGQIAVQIGNGAFLWQSGSLTPLGDLGGAGLTTPRAITESGQVVGSSLTSSGELHAFRWTAGAGIEDLGTLGGTGSKGAGANDLGQIVGSSSTLSGETHGFLWEDGVMYDLGTLSSTDQSSAVDINNLGQVVGGCALSGEENHAVLWEVPLRAAIDIVPGTEPNVLKIGGKGKLQVAVLSSGFFDAAAVDPASLTLGNEDAQDTPITRTKKSQPPSC